MSGVIRVIGCGNPEVGDDAVGLEVARRVRDRLACDPDVEVTLAGTGARALDLVLGADAVIVVDAVRTPEGGRAPGTVLRLELGAEGLPMEVASSLSSHGLGLGEVLGLTRAIDEPARVVFVGVEARDMQLGHGLSPEVRSAVPALVEVVLAEAREQAAAPAGRFAGAREATG